MFRTTTLSLFVILLALAAGSCRPKPATLESAQQYGGIYKFGDTLNREAAYGEAYIYPESDSTLLFYVYVNKGAPSYNSGSIDGRISVSRGKAVFQKRFDFGSADCRLFFEFGGDSLAILQDGRDCDCGFGHGVSIDDIFIRTSSQTPRYYTTISGDKVWFSQWSEDGVWVYPRIDDRFTACFPDLVPGSDVETRRLIPQEIAEEFLSDLLNAYGDVQPKVYAVGKVLNYKGMDLYVCDYEGERSDEDSYDNHVDGVRWLLLYGRDGSPVELENESGGLDRGMYTLGYHYYGEGGEEDFTSRFDADTTLIVTRNRSDSESATGFGTPFVCDEEYRWTITSLGGQEFLEVTCFELSSPFFDCAYLQKQDWNDVEDAGNNQCYPTKDAKWQLLNDGFESFPVKLFFHIERIDGVLTPVFESACADDDSDRIIDSYLVGKTVREPAGKFEPVRDAMLQCPIVVKTSDGELEIRPVAKILMHNK